MSTQGQLPDIRKTIVIDAPVEIEKVWKLVATSEGLASWWMPNTFRPAVGEPFVLRLGPYGESPCTVTELDPPHRGGFRWGRDWHLSFELKERKDGKTELTLIHSGWDAEKTTEFGPPHTMVYNILNGGYWSERLSVLRQAAVSGT